MTASCSIHSDVTLYSLQSLTRYLNVEEGVWPSITCRMESQSCRTGWLSSWNKHLCLVSASLLIAISSLSRWQSPERRRQVEMWEQSRAESKPSRKDWKDPASMFFYFVCGLKSQLILCYVYINRALGLHTCSLSSCKEHYTEQTWSVWTLSVPTDSLCLWLTVLCPFLSQKLLKHWWCERTGKLW